ncbi:MAG: MBL fold metallo-hydrolase [Bacillota bacterium]|jgi:ribonuclease BN (tRNA processing enzyme)
MELTVLGCWAPYPRPGGACSGYLIKDGHTALMLEAGNGTLSRLGLHFDFRQLSAVALSHLHPDHYMDIYCLRHAIEGARREGTRDDPLPLFMPGQPRGTFQELSGYTRAFQVVCIDSLSRVELAPGLWSRHARVGGNLTLDFIEAAHSLPGYGVSVTGPGGRLVYSGDTAGSQELELLAGGADLFLCEASGLDGDADYLRGVHLTARGAGELARRAGAKGLLITHFWPLYRREEFCRQAAAGYGGPVEAAIENKVYQVASEEK